MKTIIRIVLVLSLMPCILFAKDLDDVNIVDEADTMAFKVGKDQDIGTMLYIVDRITKICLVRISPLGGVFQIDCEKLKALPSIKKFLEK